MQNENKEEVIDEVIETKEDEVVETTDDTKEDETSDDKKDEGGVDHNAELIERQTTREHNKTNAEKRLQGKTSSKESVGDIKEVIKEAIQEIQVAENESRVGDLINEELSEIESDSKRALVEDYYRNTIKVSGTSKQDIKRDMALAITLADQPRITRENSELKVAAKNRSNMSNDGEGSSEQSVQVTKSKWTKAQLENFKKRGITAEQVEKTQVKLAHR